jgi:hypothetical protein
MRIAKALQKFVDAGTDESPSGSGANVDWNDVSTAILICHPPEFEGLHIHKVHDAIVQVSDSRRGAQFVMYAMDDNGTPDDSSDDARFTGGWNATRGTFEAEPLVLTFFVTTITVLLCQYGHFSGMMGGPWFSDARRGKHGGTTTTTQTDATGVNVVLPPADGFKAVRKCPRFFKRVSGRGGRTQQRAVPDVVLFCIGRCGNIGHTTTGRRQRHTR